MRKEICIIIGGQIRDLERILASYDVEVYEQVRMNDAVEMAIQLEQEGVQAIISTGGTAAEMEKHISIPVIRANPTYFDLLETFRDLELQGNVVGGNVVLFLHQSRNVLIERLQPFVKNKICFFRYQDETDLRAQVHFLSKQGFQIVVGGPTTLSFAKEVGLRGHPLYVGLETILTAYDKAVSVLHSIKKEREESQRLYTIIDLFPEGILVADETGSIILCNPRGLEIMDLKKEQVIGHKIYQVTRDPNWISVYENGSSQIDVMTEFRQKKIFSTRLPIIVGKKIIGAVGTFQEVSKIEKLEHEYRKLQTMGLVAKNTITDIVGNSDVISRTIESAKAYAQVESTVLISGETGTGKEIFAQSIHNLSNRRYGPFVAVNCAALPENLLESELMGYYEGAFTGARKSGKAGLFELAHKGTFFLDEINQIPVSLQARILRVLQEKQVMRLGGEKVIPIDVRIIAATNEDLETKITSGSFREDLYYRLNVLNLPLPALRHRLEDIPLLAQRFLETFSKVYGHTHFFSDRCLQLMTEYDWPGNVRELINFIERFMVLNRQKSINDIDFARQYIVEKRNKKTSVAGATDPNLITLNLDTMENMEEQIIRTVVGRMKGSKAKAALLLGISRTTLWKKIDRNQRLQ